MSTSGTRRAWALTAAFEKERPDGGQGDYLSGVLALLLVAFSVGLGNFGASTAIGVTGVDRHLRLRVALIFGVFEAAMPVLGLLLGRAVAHDFGTATKLVAGGLLCAAGAYSIVSKLLGGEDVGGDSQPNVKHLVFLGAALSIDNLAIGFALGSYHVSVLVAASVIAVVSVALTLAGLEVGGRLGPRLGPRSELVSGAVLVVVGVAIATGLL